MAQRGPLWKKGDHVWIPGTIDQTAAVVCLVLCPWIPPHSVGHLRVGGLRTAWKHCKTRCSYKSKMFNKAMTYKSLGRRLFCKSLMDAKVNKANSKPLIEVGNRRLHITRKHPVRVAGIWFALCGSGKVTRSLCRGKIKTITFYMTTTPIIINQKNIYMNTYLKDRKVNMLKTPPGNQRWAMTKTTLFQSWSPGCGMMWRSKNTSSKNRDIQRLPHTCSILGHSLNIVKQYC